MTLQVDVRADISLAERFVRGMERQMPFAVSKAINATALDFQHVQRGLMRKKFTIRRPSFARRAVKIKPFATKNRLFARVAIDAPGGRSDIFAKFEEGGIKRPSGRSLAIPDHARRTKTGIVGKGSRPRAFRFELVGVGRDGTKVFRGRRRTFMIQRPDGTGGIYQRIGRKGTKRRAGAGRRLASDIRTRNVRDINVRTLFRFTSQARIDERLEFVDTARSTVFKEWESNMREAFTIAVKTARR